MPESFRKLTNFHAKTMDIFRKIIQKYPSTNRNLSLLSIELHMLDRAHIKQDPVFNPLIVVVTQ